MFCKPLYHIGYGLELVWSYKFETIVLHEDKSLFGSQGRLAHHHLSRVPVYYWAPSTWFWASTLASWQTLINHARLFFSSPILVTHRSAWWLTVYILFTNDQLNCIFNFNSYFIFQASFCLKCSSCFSSYWSFLFAIYHYFLFNSCRVTMIQTFICLLFFGPRNTCLDIKFWSVVFDIFVRTCFFKRFWNFLDFTFIFRLF